MYCPPAFLLGESMYITAEDIRSDRDNAKLRIEKYESLKRLMSNPDFKKIIQNGYLKDFALSLVEARTDMSNLDSINLQLDAIAHFQKYIKDLELDGELATREYAEHDLAYDKKFDEE